APTPQKGTTRPNSGTHFQRVRFEIAGSVPFPLRFATGLLQGCYWHVRCWNKRVVCPALQRWKARWNNRYRSLMNTNRRSHVSRLQAFTLAEVAVALGISALLFSGLILGFTQSSQRAEWSSYDLAAQNLAQQGVEQARAAMWDPLAPTPKD